MSTETTTQQNTQDISNSLLLVGLKEGKHFEFLPNRKKITIKMIGDETQKRISLKTLRNCLKKQNIKYESTKGYVYLNSNEEHNDLKPEVIKLTNSSEALLYVLNLHKIFFFVKSEINDQMIIQCIDREEINKVINICSFYKIVFESLTPSFEIIISKTFDFNMITEDKVFSVEKVDPKKFSKELIDSINAVDYELDKRGVVVEKPVERLVKDVTRSTRYAMSNNRKNIRFIKDFSKEMMNVYGIDVLQDAVDQYTFFVIGPKDAEFSNSTQQSTDRFIRKTKQSVHPVSKLLIENGIKCYTSKDKQTPSFTLRLDEQKFPKSISFHCVDLKEKKRVTDEALLILKNEGYQVSLSQTKQRIVFLSVNETSKGSHPISELLKKGNFVTRKNGGNPVPAFSIRFFPKTKNVSHIAFVGGDEKERQKVAEKAKIFLAEHGFYFNRKDGFSTLTLSVDELGRQASFSRKKKVRSEQENVQTKQSSSSFMDSLSEEQIDLFLEGIPKNYLKRKFGNMLDGFVVIREKDAIAMRPELFVSVEELLKK